MESLKVVDDQADDRKAVDAEDRLPEEKEKGKGSRKENLELSPIADRSPIGILKSLIGSPRKDLVVPSAAVEVTSLARRGYLLR